MTDGGGEGISERELTCAICTEILYQPLTLLDCLHTFCGACLKEWFKWQATSASSSRRGASNPYTCPSCRESVRRTKADWRLNSLLEGFLKAHPDKTKSEQERKELEEHYTPGEDVLPPVQQMRGGDDSEDERVLAEVREMSMNDRTRRDRHGGGTSVRSRHEQVAPRLTESTLRAHDSGEPQIEHQPSLRSLLSASDENSQDVQAEILRSIYSEGLLDGIDLDNLTAEQEEELTEKIAEAYRRRHRQRDRSSQRERQQRPSRSPRSTAAGAEGSPNSRPATRENAGDAQPQQNRSRPPVSRPHLFEQTLESPAQTHRRSRSSNSQRSGQSNTGVATPPGTQSATDLSQTPSTDNSQRVRRSRDTSAGRRVTDPQATTGRIESAPLRHSNTAPGDDIRRANPPSADQAGLQSTQRPVQVDNSSIITSAPQITTPPRLNIPHTVRPALSNSAFAPEPIEDATDRETAPSIPCNRCDRHDIQYDLHYNCRWCLGGGFNLCLDCYRNGQGCNHWFGFGYRALERWHRTAPPEGWPIGFDRPHVMSARKYVKPSSQQQQGHALLEEGAFCDSCLTFSDDGYWHCPICLEGAWGYCDTCVKQGRHCTHPLTYVAHLNSLRGGNWDPAKMAFIPLPHLRQDSYVPLPVDTGCDICHRGIEANSTRFHCCECEGGDYDVCNECYRGLVAQGKISQANGPNGWRRCLKGHRMAVVGFQDTPEGGHVRITVREPVGEWLMKVGDGGAQQQQLPPTGDGGMSMRCLALYSYFPKQGVEDELTFPKYAEIREVERKNDDWFVGVYAGARGLFPANHVRNL